MLTLTVAAGDTCAGGVVDNGDGTGTYSFATNETMGGTSCDVAITCADDGTPAPALSDTEGPITVNIAEDNQAPTIISSAPTTATEDVLYSYPITCTDADDPVQTLTLTVGAGDSCGGSIVGGAYEFTPTETQGGTTCDVVVTCTDDGTPAPALSDTEGPVTVNIAEDNQQPTIALTCPGTVTEPGAINCTIVVTDDDLAPNPLVCSLAGDTCGGVLTGCTNYDVADSTGLAPGCTVGVLVDDQQAQPNSWATDAAAVVVNPEPDLLVLNCPASTGELTGTSCAPTASGPSLCSLNAATSCGGVVVAGDCSLVTIPAQGEVAQPASCDVVVDKGAVQDTDTIDLLERESAAHDRFDLPGHCDRTHFDQLYDCCQRSGHPGQRPDLFAER